MKDEDDGEDRVNACMGLLYFGSFLFIVVVAAVFWLRGTGTSHDEF
jgi:hypothetical protein